MLNGKTTDTGLVHQLERECAAYNAAGLLDHQDESPQISEWARMLRVQPKRFIRPDGTLDGARLRNFRRLRLFLTDFPGFDPNNIVQRHLTGGRRGSVRMLKEHWQMLSEQGYLNWLAKYPCSPIGNPYALHYRGHRFNYRWLRHIYLIGLLHKVFGNRLPDNCVALDIGSGYGVFSSLLKREHPGTHHVLVDFPEQLLLASYFLRKTFPDARVATLADLGSESTISRSWIEQYDFVLLPCAAYARLAAGSVDLVTNFASLGEMTPEWFRYYVHGAAFATAKWFFTANRVESRPTYDTDLTILDYPIWDSKKRLHFGVCPVFTHHYVRKHLVFSERVPFPPYFEYLGAI